MKKAKTFLLLGITLCMFGCSDDDDDKSNTTSTVPFSLTASLEVRNDAATTPGMLQGNWNEGTKLAAMHSGLTGVKKSIFTLSSTSTDLFTGDISNKVKRDKEIAVFYPADAITANSSDTLTQQLSLANQDGTLAGVANYDYSWALCKVNMTAQSGSGSCEMKNLMTIGKFEFTTDGSTLLNDISRITVTATSGKLYSNATLKLKDGEFSNTTEGSFTIKNDAGLPGSAYISFFPSEAQLHFTLVTNAGNIYEASTTESITLEKGKYYASAALTCTPVAPAKVGDYYYSDGTYSTEMNEEKTCIGIVYALNDKNGNLDKTLTTSPYGRIVALTNARNKVRWASKSEDIEGLKNDTIINGTQQIGCLPYFNGTADSYFSDNAEEQIKGTTINTETGLITAWPSEGILSDFNGATNTSYINKSTSTYPAGSYCYQYSKPGKGAGEWYLPAVGELALLWELHHAGVICNAKQECFKDFDQQSYWTSSEGNKNKAWYLNFFSGILMANSKGSTYNTRPVAMF